MVFSKRIILISFFYTVILYFPNTALCFNGSITLHPGIEGGLSCGNYLSDHAYGDYFETDSINIINTSIGESNYTNGGTLSPNSRDGYLDVIFLLPEIYDYTNATFEISLLGKGTSFGNDEISVFIMNDNEEYFFNHQCTYFSFFTDFQQWNESIFDNIMFSQIEDEELKTSQPFTIVNVGNYFESRHSIYSRIKVEDSDEVDLKFIVLNWYGATLNLDLALDNSDLNFTTIDWYGQSDEYYYDGDAARSGTIGDGEFSEISTGLQGPGTLSFFWKVSSEENHDSLKFYYDDETSPRMIIHGVVDWQQAIFDIPTGSHIVKWEYSKDGSFSYGEDCGWLDKVQLCSFEISPASINIPPSGGTQEVSVNSSNNECSWMASENLDWVSITPSNGVGNGTVTITIEPNDGSIRNGYVIIAGQTFHIFQSEHICTYFISPSNISFSSSGGNHDINIYPSNLECPWSVSENLPWAGISPTNGFGDGIVTVTVAPNHGEARIGDAVIAGQIFSITQDSGVPEPGDRVWVFQSESDWCGTSSPAIGEDGTIYIGMADDYFYAFNPDGSQKWKILLDRLGWSSVVLDSSGTLLIGSENGNLYAINPDGSQKWVFQTAGSIRSSPAVGLDGTIYIGSEDFNLYAIHPNGLLKWKYQIGGHIIGSSPAVGSDGTIYVGSWGDYLHAINPDGSKKWVAQTGRWNYYSSPAIGPTGNVYVGSYDYNLYSINPDGTTNWIFLTGGVIDSSPSIGPDGTIYVGSGDGKLYAINPDGSKKWDLQTNSEIYSSPSIGSDGLIYITQQVGDLYAINMDGTIEWTYPMVGSYSHPSIGTNNTLYLTAQDGTFHAVHINSDGLADSPWPKFHKDLRNTGRHNPGFLSPGTEKWSFPVETYIPYSSSAAIDSNGTIYVGAGNNLYALTFWGTFKWVFATADAIASSPTIGADGTIYVGSNDYNLYAINPDGTLKWKFYTESWVYSSPGIDLNGTIYVGSFDGKLYAINPNGTKKWDYSTGGVIESSPAIGSDGIIYFGSYDGSVYALNPDGTKKWSSVLGGEVYGSPAIDADGTIYVGSMDGKLYALNPDGTLKWSSTIGSVGFSVSIGSDGTIYAGLYDKPEGGFVSFNPNGTLQWTFQPAEGVLSCPLIGSNGTIYFGSSDGKLYAVNPNGTKRWSFDARSMISSSPALGKEGTIIFTTLDGMIYAVNSESMDISSSPWPMFHHDLKHTGSIEVDTDGDGLSDAMENDLCSNAIDADTDDDGIIDGIEDDNHNGIVDPGETDPCKIDTDGDGIQDGTETGITLADVESDTDLSYFLPDLDPETTTNPTHNDSDQDGTPDGEEDANHNGKLDKNETSPLQIDYYVNISGSDSIGDGSKALPWKTIQYAINQAIAESIIHLAEGTYSGPGNKNIDFLGKPVVLISESGPESTIIDCEGGGRAFIFQNNEDQYTKISGIKIINGYVDSDGGGILCVASSPSISNCIILDNTSSISGGGGIHCQDASPRVTNTIVANNHSGIFSNGGGGLYCQNASPIITNCTFFGNMSHTTNRAHGIKIDTDSSPLILNSIIYGLPPDYSDAPIITESAQAIVKYCNVEGDYYGEGNINLDPIFVSISPSTLDLHLSYNSPCIDAGNPATDYSLEPQPNGNRINIGAYGGTSEATTTPIDTDQDGILDIIEGTTCTNPADADTDDDGILDGVEDANHNGVVDAGETNPCSADTDSDGIQDGTEIGLTLADIGPDTDAGVFIPDADPTTATDPLDDDSDNDGRLDGEEDLNHNGAVDGEETDPNAAERTSAMPWIPLLLFE